MSSNTNNPWQLAIRLEVLDGKDLVDKFRKAKHYGFDAVELPGRQFSQFQQELLTVKTSLALPISSISLGFRGSLLAPDADVRKQCRQDIGELLGLCSELGAAGLVMPPALYQDNGPWAHNTDSDPDSRAYYDKLLTEELAKVAVYAEKTQSLLFLEPVNQSETGYMNSIAHAAALCERIGHANIGIAADYFHMHLEEPDPLESLREANKWIRHVHIADNTRMEPGCGNLDFEGFFRTLYEIGYQGYIVVECRSLSGQANEVLGSCVSYLRATIAAVCD